MMSSGTAVKKSAAAVLLVMGALCAGDWPAYRYDFARSGVTPEELQTPLHLQWRHVAAHAPVPAWPEPGRELNRLDFDKVYHVVVGNGLVYYGSSADHQVFAVDLASGRVRWHFCTGGPVRFAPAVGGGRVFVGSDDGQVYCLNAGDGKVEWAFSAGPRADLLLGNGRMTSRWPIRTGVAVENGIVYFAAGTWPSEGVLLYALNAADGRPVWVNDTSGTMYVTQPHPGSFSMTGVAPQGYVLGHKGQIFVPTGRNVPAAYDRSNGKVMYYRSAPSGWGNRWGGCWNFLADGLLVGWRCHTGPDIDVLIGEYQPHPQDGIVVFDAKTGREIREVGGPLRAVIKDGFLYTSGKEKVCATDLAAWLKRAGKNKWEVPQGRTYELIMAGDTLLVGGQGRVSAIDAGSGKVSWEAKVAGQARGLAVASGRLLVSTTEGEILCYGPNAVASPPIVSYRLRPAGRPNCCRVASSRLWPSSSGSSPALSRR